MDDYGNLKLTVDYNDFVKEYRETHRNALYYPEVLRLRKEGYTIPEIREEIGENISQSLLYSWTSADRVPLPVKDFRELKTEFSNTDISDLAVIVGHIIGDGGISRDHVLHYCNTEEFLIEKFRSSMSNLFGTNKKPREEPSGIMRLNYGRKYSRLMRSLFGNFAEGSKDNSDNKRITEQIEVMPDDWKNTMLRSLYEDDGSVPRTQNYVSLKQKHKRIITWVRKHLKQLGIHSGLTEDNSLWLLRVSGYSNLMKFRKEIGFSPGYRKGNQLDRIIDGISHPHLATKKRIVRLLGKRPRTAGEIAQILGVDKDLIWGHLSGWKRSKESERKSHPGLMDLGVVTTRKRDKKVNLYYISSDEKSRKLLSGDLKFRD